MKLLIRFMSLIIIGFIISVSLIYLININIMKNEMDNATRISIESCQNIIKSRIIDNYLSLDESSYPIYDNNSYKEYFIDSFNGLVSNNNIYDLKVYTNYEKGLIGVIVHNNYSSFINDLREVNIIEVSE